MDPFAVLGQRVADATRRDLGHSALPGAPVQPVVERRRPVRRVVRRAVRRLGPAASMLARRGMRVAAVRHRLPLRSPAVTSREACNSG